MATRDGHSRRDFLQGRAAAEVLVDQAQTWVDSAAEALGNAVLPRATMHVRACRRAMACEFAVQYHMEDGDAAEHALTALDLIETLESQMSIYRDHSEVIAINRQAADSAVPVEAGLFAQLELAARLHAATDGAFDITSGPLSQVWGFLQRVPRVPSEEEIRSVLDRVGFDKLALDSPRQTIRFLHPGVEINFNSIGKGYALDRAAAWLASHGVTDYLWHGGQSSVLASGRNRAGQTDAWTIGLRHPHDPEHYLAEIHLRDRALATAGGATQFFEQESQRYCHILDPRTGWPVEGMLSATALATTAAEADALATAFFVMDVDAVRQYCRVHPDIGAVLVCLELETAQVSLHSFGLDQADWATPGEPTCD